MPAVDFDRLPDSARLWIFAAPHPLSADAVSLLRNGVESFLAAWNAHGAAVVGGYDWRHDHFLLVAADEEATGVSGCSIDSLFRTLKKLEADVGASLVDSSPIWYRDPNGAVACVSRSDFRAMVEAGEVGATTIVFDNTVVTVGGVRAGGWERPFSGSWQERAYARR